jgi:hypothetical protein
MNERLYLVSKGTPWGVAWDWPPDELIAFMVTFASFDGLEWDWHLMKLREPG